MNTLEILLKEGLYVKGSPLKLHLGCGSNYLKDYINMDLPSSEHSVMISTADAEADIVKDLSFPQSSVDEVRSHHVFEHFSRITALTQLIKWHYWLKINGILIIETPDFMGSVEQLSKSTDYNLHTSVVRHLVGDQSDRWAFHVEQWWAERFEKTLYAFGFKNIKIMKKMRSSYPYLRSIEVQAKKCNNIEVKEQLKAGYVILKDSIISERELKTYNVWCNQLLKELEDIL